MSQSSEADICSICISSLVQHDKNILTTTCGHKFHFDCLIKSVAAQNQECPLCRTRLNELTKLVGSTASAAPTQTIQRRRGLLETIWHTASNVFTKSKSDSSEGTNENEEVDQNQVEIIIRKIEEYRRRNADQTGQLQQITVNTTLEYQAQAFDHESNMFGMVKLVAPSLFSDITDEKELEELRVPVDIVCVIDQSGSMTGDKIRLLKETLYYLINQLKSLDRLAIISFDTEATNQSEGLRKMTPATKAVLKSAISNRVNPSGGTYIGSGLKMAIELLNRRRTKNTTGVLLLLTDGQDNQNHNYSNVMKKLPSDVVCHTFGYGLGHQADLLSQLAEQGNNGTFTFIDQFDSVSNAFATVIGSLFTCVAQNIEVKLKFENPYSIIRAHSLYPYKPSHFPTSTLTFQLQDLNAEEVRHLLFELTVPKLKVASNNEDNIIGHVSLEYTDTVNRSTITTDRVAFVLPRPSQLSPTSPLRQVDYLLDVQRNRVETSRVLREAVRKTNFQESKEMIDEQIRQIRGSISVEDPLCQQLIRDLEHQHVSQDQMITTITNIAMQHGQERATYTSSTMCSSDRYVTRGQERYRDRMRKN